MKSNKRCPAWIGAAVAYPPGHHGKPGPHKMIRPHGMLTDGSCIRQCQVWHPMRFLLTLPMVTCLQVRRACLLVSKWRPCTCVDQLDAVGARMHVVGQLCARMHVVDQLCAHARWDGRVWISRARARCGSVGCSQDQFTFMAFSTEFYFQKQMSKWRVTCGWLDLGQVKQLRVGAVGYSLS